MEYLLGLDFGGGASKATLLRTDGTVVCEAMSEYPTAHPTAQACEQNPDDWIAALCKNVGKILSSGFDAKDVLAVAVDSATHTSVVCDADFRPLRPAIHWTDSRSREQAERLRREYGDRIFSKTYHRPDTIWTLPQLLWLRENEPATFGKIKHVFFEKDYIRRFLTGTYETDCIEAEGSMFFDCNRGVWDKDLLALAGLSEEMLPEIVKPTDVVGSVSAEASEATGLSRGTPVLCGTTDTVMEIFAAGASEAGQMTVKLATAGRICVITDRPYPDAQLVTYSHVVPGMWYPGTATKAAGASYRWYRDTFGASYADSDTAAKEIPIGCDGLIFHPYLNGELTPYADPMLSGSFTGIRSTHTRGHFARAVMEGVSLSLLDCKRYLDALQIPHGNTATLIGGGAKGEIWRQITADVLGMKLITTENTDSSFGSAMLAGIAAGVFADPADAIAKCVRVRGVTEPDPENSEKYAAVFETYRKIHDALAPIYGGRK